MSASEGLLGFPPSESFSGLLSFSFFRSLFPSFLVSPSDPLLVFLSFLSPPLSAFFLSRFDFVTPKFDSVFVVGVVGSALVSSSPAPEAEPVLSTRNPPDSGAVILVGEAVPLALLSIPLLGKS